MKFPKMIYKYPGSISLQDGSYDHIIVEDQDELDSRLSAGWFETPSEAKANHDKPAEIKAEPVKAEIPIELDKPPTRAELEQKAAELGIKPDGRWSDSRLASEIDAALKA